MDLVITQMGLKGRGGVRLVVGHPHLVQVQRKESVTIAVEGNLGIRVLNEEGIVAYLLIGKSRKRKKMEEIHPLTEGIRALHHQKKKNTERIKKRN